MPSAIEFNENTPLSKLAFEINRLAKALNDYTRNALRVALDEGELLTLAKARLGSRRWKDWRTENCPNLTKRTDELYRRLASYRGRIEREIERNPDLSIREANSLISTPKPPRPPKPAALEKWALLSAEDKAAGLAADGIAQVLQYMPPGIREALADQLARVHHKTVKDRELSNRLREHIKTHPDDPFVKFIRAQAIEPKHIEVRVGAIDAPSNRRPPLLNAQSLAISTVH
jgi:hypothetical protein